MLEVENLTKSYGGRWILKGVSFDVPAGAVFGLLGPNGAGKSTLLSVISTLQEPSGGRVSIGGVELKGGGSRVKNLVGIVPQDISLYQDLTAQENLWFWGRLYRIPRYDLKKRISEVLSRVGLSDVRQERVRHYSGGMKRRLNLAASILHRPRVLLMDEPTVGVDPFSRSTIFELIEQLRGDGVSIVLATHYIEEAERLSDQVGILHEGRMAALGSLQDLMLRYGAGLDYRIQADGTPVNELKFLLDDGALEFDPDRNQFRLAGIHANEHLPVVLAQLMESGMKIRSVESIERGLESVFVKLTGKSFDGDYA